MSSEVLKTSGIVSIDYCIANYMVDLGGYSDKNYERLFQMALHQYSELNIHSDQKIEVEYLQMDDQGIVDFSDLTDYITWTKIGMPINGKIWTLGVNNDILLRRDTIPSDIADDIFNNNDSNNFNYGYYFAPHYRMGTFVDGLFGIGQGTAKSYFRIDEENRNIQFDTSVPGDNIIFEYQSTGIKVTGNTLIPRAAANVIMEYLHWRLRKNDRSYTRGEVLDAKEDWKEALAAYEFSVKKISIQQYLEALSAGKQQGPKR